jgi:D-alanyl-D-alanine dipeptidase
LIEWAFLYPLTELGPDEFAFPDSGLYLGEKILFERDGEGRAKTAVAASVPFARRVIGTEQGQTFRIDPVRPIDELRRDALAARPPPQPEGLLKPDLVELVSLDPTIRVDIRYATTNNFLGSVFYPVAKALLQRPAAEAVTRAHAQLKKQGYGLLIHDAYRPWYVTKMFADATPASMQHFVANPAKGSVHNRGAAVDLTLYEIASGKPVEMVGGYDEFSERSYPDYMGGTSLQRWHRELLRDAMEAEGFSVYRYEWWHFDYKDAARYPVLNMPLEIAGSPAGE